MITQTMGSTLREKCDRKGTYKRFYSKAWMREKALDVELVGILCLKEYSVTSTILPECKTLLQKIVRMVMIL